jgi:hypothetical protein
MAAEDEVFVEVVSGPVDEEVDETLEIVEGCLVPLEAVGVAVFRRFSFPYIFGTELVRRDVRRDEAFTGDSAGGVGSR